MLVFNNGFNMVKNIVLKTMCLNNNGSKPMFKNSILKTICFNIVKNNVFNTGFKTLFLNNVFKAYQNLQIKT